METIISRKSQTGLQGQMWTREKEPPLKKKKRSKCAQVHTQDSKDGP